MVRVARKLAIQVAEVVVAGRTSLEIHLRDGHVRLECLKLTGRATGVRSLTLKCRKISKNMYLVLYVPVHVFLTKRTNYVLLPSVTKDGHNSFKMARPSESFMGLPVPL